MSKWTRREQDARGLFFAFMHSISRMNAIGPIVLVSPRVTVKGESPPAITLLSARTAWIASAPAFTIAA